MGHIVNSRKPRTGNTVAHEVTGSKTTCSEGPWRTQLGNEGRDGGSPKKGWEGPEWPQTNVPALAGRLPGLVLWLRQ